MWYKCWESVVRNGCSLKSRNLTSNMGSSTVGDVVVVSMMILVSPVIPLLISVTLPPTEFHGLPHQRRSILYALDGNSELPFCQRFIPSSILLIVGLPQLLSRVCLRKMTSQTPNNLRIYVLSTSRLTRPSDQLLDSVLIQPTNHYWLIYPVWKMPSTWFGTLVHFGIPRMNTCVRMFSLIVTWLRLRRSRPMSWRMKKRSAYSTTNRDLTKSTAQPPIQIFVPTVRSKDDTASVAMVIQSSAASDNVASTSSNPAPAPALPSSPTDKGSSTSSKWLGVTGCLPTIQSCLLLNANRLSTKLSELHHLLYTSSSPLIFVTESWLSNIEGSSDNISDSELDPNQYFTIYKCNRVGRQGGGVIVFVAASFRSHQIILSDSDHVDLIESGCELLCFTLFTGSSKIRLFWFIDLQIRV